MILFLSILVLIFNYSLYLFLTESLLERKYSMGITLMVFGLIAAVVLVLKLHFLLPTTYVSLAALLLLVLFSGIFYAGSLDQILFVLVGYAATSLVGNYIILIPVVLFMDSEIMANINFSDWRTLFMSGITCAAGWGLGFLFVYFSRKYIYRYSLWIVVGLFFFLQIFLLYLQPIMEVSMGYAGHRAYGDALFPFLLALMDIVLLIGFAVSEHRKGLSQKLLAADYFKQTEENYLRAVCDYRSENEELRSMLLSHVNRMEDAIRHHEWDHAACVADAFWLDVEESKSLSECDNVIVNAVLLQKGKVCRKEGISFKRKVQIPEETGISPMHLCNLFSNLLDNAIRASLALSREERRITLLATLDKGFLQIVLENTALTEKTAPRARHGYGMRILSDIAKEYEGTMEHSFQDGIFTTRILLQMK